MFVFPLFKYILIDMKNMRQEPSRQDQEELLKKLLHQNGMCLLIYPQGSNTSLLTALAETIHASEEGLHQKLIEKLEHDRTHYTLPRRLHYLYEDGSIVQDFKKHPELVQFSKLILELFSASTLRRLNLFSLAGGSDNQYNLSCLIINEKGYTQSISIARIANKYYNIKQRDIDSKHNLSLEDVFKDSPQIDSEELIQTFKQTIIQKIPDKDQTKAEKPKAQQPRSSVKIDEFQQVEFNLKRAKSSMPYRQFEQVAIKENDGVSLGDKLEFREDARLINQCSNNGLQNSYQAVGYHPNHLVQMTPQQLYYYYYQNPYYATGKSQPFLNYSQHVPIHSLSPSKNPLYKAPAPVQPIQNYYPSQTYAPAVVTNPAETGQNKRYAGRLKFFDEAKNYGFIIMDADQSDIFVHYDDLQKAGISKDIIKSIKNEMYMQIRFSFKVMEYFGKYKKSRKAVDLIIIDDGLNLINSYPILTQ